MANRSQRRKQAKSKSKSKSKNKDRQGATPAAVWKQQRRAGLPFELRVPSGNTCLVKPAPGMGSFMERGMVPNALMPIVQEALDADEHSEDPEELRKKSEELLKDEDKLLDVMKMINEVCLDVVLQPPLHPVPFGPDDIPLDLDDPERDLSLLYVDEVDLQDRIFIFQVAVGGTTDLTQFRIKQAIPMDSVQPE